jgi:hypothetical protein
MKNDNSIRFPRLFTLAMVVLLLLPLLLTGCASTASKAASFAVSSYCKIPGGTIGRKGIRTAFNDAVYPHKVVVTCSND